MDTTTPSVLGVVGSLRQASLNARLLARAGALTPTGVRFVVFDQLGEIPHFSQDLEPDTPTAVTAFRSAIEHADALLVATPEYNSAMPGVLKNALDWASRPPGRSVLQGKHVAALGASPGRFGAQRAQADVRRVLAAIGADVLGREFLLPRAHEAFTDEGHLVDPEQESELATFISALVEHAGLPSGAEDELAVYSHACQQIAS